MIEALWNLPGPGRVVGDLADELSARRSVVLVRPRSASLDGLERALRARTDGDWVNLECGQLNGGGNLAERIHAHFGLPPDTAGSLDALLERLDGRLLWVAPDSSDDARALASLVNELAALRARRGKGPLLCVCATEDQLEPLPTAEKGLVVLWWWGRIGPLDTRVVVDAAMPERRVLGDVDVVAECCTYALDVADSLARGWTGAPASDLARVTSSAALMGDEERVRTCTTRTSAPPSGLREAWNAGLVEWWGDHLAVHPACVMDDQAKLDQRVWRGLLASVLPYVEVRRQALARWAADRRHLTSMTLTVDQIVDLECGPLLAFIRGEHRLKSSRGVMELASALLHARNALAHLEPLDRAWLEQHERLLASTTIS